MTALLFERVPLVDRDARRRIEQLSDARELITGQALDWPGVLIESGRNYVTGVDAVALGYHYLGMNAGPSPVLMRGVRGPHPDRDITFAPGAVWVVPAGDPVSFSVAPLRAGIWLAIDPRHGERLLERARGDGATLELRRTYGVDVPQVRHLMLALLAEAQAHLSSGLAFVETLTAALVQQVLMHAGVERPAPERARGGLSPGARRRVLELIDANLEARLSIDTLAAEVGLSSAHFSRAFKETVGQPPHRFLLAQRLERARRLLETGAQLSDVAARTGFADQAHFTRHFKRQFGVTPGALRRARRCA